jgi:glucosyl-3-phosphoglycerate synthase
MRVSLLVPAKDEADTIEPTLSLLQQVLREKVVTDAIVLDSGSTDNTADLVQGAGLRCEVAGSICRECGPLLGKGDSLWRGLHLTAADVYVFLDADLGNVTVEKIDALIEPLRQSPDAMFVKSGFTRVDENGLPREKSAGRVTEEVGRPLAATEHLWLAELSQPLSGQVAVRAEALRGRSIATGYGVEIAMLIDMWRAYGERGIVEVQWGALYNRWKPDEALSEVRSQVLAGASLRGVSLQQYGTCTDPNVVDRLV